MAKNRTVQDLLEIKAREKYGTRANIYYGRISALKSAFEAGSFKVGDEVLRYFPIGAIAAVESYFRAAYAELLDAGEPYASRIEPLIRDLRIDWRAVRAIEGKAVSSGEVVAHSLPLSSLGDIQRVMNGLLGGDFLDLLRRTPKSGMAEAQSAHDLVLPYPDQCFKYVSRAFELRHIFCHESATSVTIDDLEVLACLNWCQSFLYATGELLLRALFTDWGLSQAELTNKAIIKLDSARQELARVENELRRVFGGYDRAKTLFREVQGKWHDFANANADLVVFLWEGGSGYPMAHSSALEEATKRRTEELTKQLREWEGFRDPV